MGQKLEVAGASLGFAGASHPDRMSAEVEKACQAVFEAQRSLLEVGKPTSTPDPNSPSPSDDLVRLGRARRMAALEAVKRLPAETRPAVNSKLGLALAMVDDWWSDDNVIALQFALHVLREAAPFFAAGRPTAGRSLGDRMNGRDSRVPWFERFPRLSWFAGEQRSALRNGGRHSHG